MILLGTFLTHLLCGLSPNCFPKFDNPKVQDLGGVKIGFRDQTPPIPRVEYPIVQTDSGLVQGYSMKTIGGRDIHAFEGIPFAEPPVGNLRFRSPQKVSNWTGVKYTATKGNNHCIQIDLAKFFAITGSEDCLYMNLYTPEVPTKNFTFEDSNYPVLVWFYGGAFFFGSKDTYGPSYLLDKDVILITINYRLGALGFLSTGDENSPGNYGLKDQNFALKWIQKNIRNFGGDPNRVTLIGQSAGAASVHYHMLSKQSKGLFSSGISLSGSALCPWALPREILLSGQKIGRSLNCPTGDSKAFVKCMRTKSAFAITGAQSKLLEWMNFPVINFGPTVEPEGPEAFLTAEPRELYARGEVNKVPWISGFVPDEGNVYNIVMMMTPFAYYAFNRNFDKIIPMAMDFRHTKGLVDTSKTIQKIRNYYFGDKDISPRTYRQYSDMFGDRFILSGVYEGMVEHAKAGAPTYGYYFDYKGNFSILQRTGMTREESGTSHYDDVMYVFNSSDFHPSMEYNHPDFAITEFIVDLFANFATNLEPLHTNELGDEVKFWDPIKLSSANNAVELNEFEKENLLTPSRARLARNIKYNGKLQIPQILEINQKPQLIPFPKKFLSRMEFWKDLNLPNKIIR